MDLIYLKLPLRLTFAAMASKRDCVAVACQTATQFERITNLDVSHFAYHYLYKILPKVVF